MVSEIRNNQASSLFLSYKSASLEISGTSTRVQADGPQSLVADSVSLRSTSFSMRTYNGSLQLQDVADGGYEKLRDYVTSLLKDQGINTKIATNDTTIDLDTIDPAQARELISDDGFFGVQQTSDRIFKLAIGIAGGDTSRIDAIKEGIDKGFSEAKKAFGNWLPDISYDTYDAVMEKLDNWVAESKAVA
jgi:hypothetical protein